MKTAAKAFGLSLSTVIALASGTAAASTSPGRAHVSGVHATATPIVNWASWTEPATFAQGNSSNGLATGVDGQITLPDGTTVYLGFSGEVLTRSYAESPSAFGVSGTTYWSGRGNGGAAYMSANVPNLPTNGDRLGVDGRDYPAQSLNFYADSARTTPVDVSNIVMNIYSVGGATARILGQWDFDNDFVILKDNGPIDSNGALGFTRTENAGSPPTYSLKGMEGAGQLQFPGTYNKISWLVAAPEYFATWNIGVTSFAAPGSPITATFDSQGGSAISSVATTSGGTLSDPGSPTRDGYTFDGWYTESTFFRKVTFPYSHGQGADFTLYAKWTAVSTTTTFPSSSVPAGSGNGGGGSTSGTTSDSAHTAASSTDELPVAGSPWGLLLAVSAMALFASGVSLSRRERTYKGWT